MGDIQVNSKLNNPVQLPISDLKLSFLSTNQVWKKLKCEMGWFKHGTFYCIKYWCCHVTNMHIFSDMYFTAYPKFPVAQYSVNVDFPSVLEAGGGVLNPCFEKSSLLKRALALVVELGKSLVYINIKILIKMWTSNSIKMDSKAEHACCWFFLLGVTWRDERNKIAQVQSS